MNQTALDLYSRRRLRCSGSAIVLIMLGMTALFGFVAVGVDYAMMNYYGQRMQNAFDAAALSGAAELKLTANETTNSTNAINKAIATASQNSITITASDVTISNSYQRIRVQKSITYPTFFAHILGQNSVVITRHSTAEKSGVSQLIGSIPLAINEADATDYSEQELLVERNQEADFTENEMLALDLGMSSSKSLGEYTDALENGSDKSVAIGNTPVSLNAETAADKKTYNSLDERIDNGNTIVIVPIIGDAVDSNGNSYHGIIGFAGVELLSVDYRNNQSVKETYVILQVIRGHAVNSETVQGFASTGSESQVYAIRLIDDMG